MTARIRQASTPDLKFQYVQALQRIYLAGHGHQRPTGFTGKTAREYDEMEAQRIAQELHQRWVAGDKGAYLPEFGMAANLEVAQQKPARARGSSSTVIARARSAPQPVQVREYRFFYRDAPASTPPPRATPAPQSPTHRPMVI
jgi:hypothetical protein